MADDVRDVFISYGRADADWVRTLAENLHNSGLEVFFDEWDIAAGDVLVHRLDEGILKSRSGALIVSPASLSRPYVQEEYAAMMTRAIAGKQRLIPVLLKDAEMPPLLASRIWVDFRNADGPDYLARVDELVRTLKGERRGPPPRTGGLSLPPGTGFKAVGALAGRLSISREQTSFSANGADIADKPPNPGLDVDDLTWRLKRARGDWGPLRDASHGGSGYVGLESVLQEAGTRLADAFLPAAVASALISALAEAESLNSPLQLALDIADPLADLPWEILRLPQTGALALNPRIELYRRVQIDGAAPAIAFPAPCASWSRSAAPRRRTPAANCSTWKWNCSGFSMPPTRHAVPGRPLSISLSRAASARYIPNWRSGAITCSTSPVMPVRTSSFWRMRTAERTRSQRSASATRRSRRSESHLSSYWPGARPANTWPDPRENSGKAPRVGANIGQARRAGGHRDAGAGG